MLERKTEEKFAVVYFTAAAVLMYYFIEQVIQLQVYITFRHAFALLIIFSGVVCFLVRPNIARASVAVKAGAVLSIPVLVMLTASLLIWCVERTDVDLITRGLSYYFIFMNQASAAFAAVVFLYMFGERGVWYNLIAILISNLMMIVTVMLEYGVGTYFSELWTLIRTFASETGSVIIHAEIHELAFCTGAYLAYMLFHIRKKPSFWLLLGLTGFCFISAFKRIAMVAIAGALALGYLLKLLQRRGKGALARKLVTAIMVGAVVLLVAYIGAVKLGVFSWMEEAGIDTSGRAGIYEAIDDYYEFSPVFLGRGMGFLTYQLNENVSLGVGAIHNDFLQYFIDLGFVGYVLWLLSITLLRVKYFGRGGKTENELVAFVVLSYMLLVSTTDNTLNYQLFYSVMAILIAGHGFDERVREEEERLFGYISPENRERKDEGLL